jgi:hypothetical protein
VVRSLIRKQKRRCTDTQRDRKHRNTHGVYCTAQLVEQTYHGTITRKLYDQETREFYTGAPCRGSGCAEAKILTLRVKRNTKSRSTSKKLAILKLNNMNARVNQPLQMYIMKRKGLATDGAITHLCEDGVCMICGAALNFVGHTRSTNILNNKPL